MIPKALCIGLGRLPSFGRLGLGMMLGLIMAKVLDDLFRVEPVRVVQQKEDSFDRFETALQGVLADGKANKAEMKFLDELLKEEEKPVRVKDFAQDSRVVLAEQQGLGFFGSFTIYDYFFHQEPEVQYIDTRTTDDTDQIDKPEALKTLYKAVAADGKINKKEIKQLRKLMAA